VPPNSRGRVPRPHHDGTSPDFMEVASLFFTQKRSSFANVLPHSLIPVSRHRPSAALLNRTPSFSSSPLCAADTRDRFTLWTIPLGAQSSRRSHPPVARTRAKRAIFSFPLFLQFRCTSSASTKCYPPFFLTKLLPRLRRLRPCAFRPSTLKSRSSRLLFCKLSALGLEIPPGLRSRSISPLPVMYLVVSTP